MGTQAQLDRDIQQEAEFSLTASYLLEYLFCPRFTYFEYVLDIPQHEEKRFKVEVGRTIHEKIRKANIGYLRKKFGVKEKKMDVYLSSPSGIRGIVDEILFLNDDTAAHLITSMPSIKRGRSKITVTNWSFMLNLLRIIFIFQLHEGSLSILEAGTSWSKCPFRRRILKNYRKSYQRFWTLFSSAGIRSQPNISSVARIAATEIFAISRLWGIFHSELGG